MALAADGRHALECRKGSMKMCKKLASADFVMLQQFLSAFVYLLGNSFWCGPYSLHRRGRTSSLVESCIFLQSFGLLFLLLELVGKSCSKKIDVGSLSPKVDPAILGTG